MDRISPKLWPPRRVPVWALTLIAVWTFVLSLLFVWLLMPKDGTLIQRLVFSLVSASVLSAGATFAASAWFGGKSRKLPVWACPLTAGLLGLVLYVLAYAYLGVYPMGEKSVLVVDMHHQYAPLLSELREMLFSGEGFFYNFHIGLGSSFLPTFAYYLASPLNVLLLLFPPRFLAEGIFCITLIKGAGMAAAFAACAQYLTRRRSSGVLALSLLYALSGFMMAYAWNIMWIDGILMLPIVVLCMEHMLRTGRILPYALLLALALFANYYIGFMLCVFLVLYMAVWLLRERRNAKDWLLGCGRFALGSLLAGGLAACLLVPVAMALGRTSAAGESLGQFSTNFPLFELVGRLLYGATPTIRSGNLPNLYCGLPAVLLLPLYLTRKQIPLRRRACYGILLGVLLVSCTLSQWDLLWHGLHSPNDLPYRFSFLVAFVMLLIAGQVLAHPEHITPRQVFGSLAGCAAYLVLWEYLDKETGPTDLVLYTNLLLLVVYGVILLIAAYRRAPRRMLSRLMLLAVCFELICGSGSTLEKVDENEYFTNTGNYLQNDHAEADKAAVEYVQNLAKEELGEDYYRMEFLPRFTCMDPVMYHYTGLTTFASSYPYLTTLFMGGMGYAINGVNSHMYHSFVPAVDSLLGLRYLILEANITNHRQLEKVGQVTRGEQTRYIYRNRFALPLGYMSTPDIRYYGTMKYDPFVNHDKLYRALSGDWVTLYEHLTPEPLTDEATISGTSSFFVPGGEEASTFLATIEEEGQYFAYVECGAAKDIYVRSYDTDGNEESSWSIPYYESYIIDMGTMRPGESVRVEITSEGSATGNVYVTRLDTEEMVDTLTTLQKGGMTVTKQGEGYIEGTVTAEQNGVLLLTLPYDKGWTVEVDGQAVETFPLAANEEDTDGALLCAEVSAGQHTVVMTYRVPGLTLGLAVSLVSLVGLLLVWLLPILHRRHKARRKVRLSAAAGRASVPEDTPTQAEPNER